VLLIGSSWRRGPWTVDRGP